MLIQAYIYCPIHPKTKYSDVISAVADLGGARDGWDQFIFTCIINRGNWYWDSEERTKPDVQHYYCDREHKLEEHCPELMELLNTVEKFEAVIDFSSFGGFQVNDSVKVLTVNISTSKDVW